MRWKGVSGIKGIRNVKPYTLTFNRGPGLMVAMSPVPSCEREMYLMSQQIVCLKYKSQTIHYKLHVPVVAT